MKRIIVVCLSVLLSSCAYLNPVKDKCVEIRGVAQVNLAAGPATSGAHLSTPDSHYRSAPPGKECWFSEREDSNG